MEHYFAPMQGLTTALFRRVHYEYFPGTDLYYTPFLAAHQTLNFKQKEIRDILPENTGLVPTIPQVLGNKADQVAWAVAKIAGYGYREINFNLGCSMPTVAKRGKGAGFLKDPDLLDRFFDSFFGILEKDYGLSASAEPGEPGYAGDSSGTARTVGIELNRTAEKATNSGKRADPGRETSSRTQYSIRFTVKTRIGTADASQADELMRVYNRYPISMLIIHPRTARDLYGNTPDLETFGRMLEESCHPVCYNGDVCTVEDVKTLTTRFPQLERVMIGRGLIRNPALVRELQGREKLTEKESFCFLTRLYQEYLKLYPDSRQAVDKMKGIWTYHGNWFKGKEKALKAIRKSRTAQEYEEAVNWLFDTAV